MSTGINIAPSSDITVGATAVTSGTNGRVFFQAGGVVQQDANFTFDNTLKRLTLKAAGTAGTDIPFVIRNSADTRNILEVLGNDVVRYQSGSSLSQIIWQKVTNGSQQLMTNNFSSITVSIDSAAGDLYTTQGVRLGSSAFGLINNGGQDLSVKGADIFGAEYFNLRMYGGTNVGDYKFKTNTNTGAVFFTTSRFDGSNPFVITDAARVGIGTNSPQSRLDVRAQGALSTDIAFRVRNSVDNTDLFSVQGNAITNFGGGTVGGSQLQVVCGSLGWGTNLTLQFASSKSISCLNGGVVETGININHNSNTRVSGLMIGSSTGTQVYIDGGQNIRIGQGFSNINQPDANATRTIQQMTGVAPTTSVADGFQQYSADITAGNAAPHFRTENGAIVKVYQETTAVAASTLVGNAGANITDTDTFDGYTLKQIVKALRNQGLLA